MRSTAARCARSSARAAGRKSALRDKAGGEARVAADEQVVDHAKVRQQLAVLESARYRAGRRVRPLAGDAPAAEENVAASRAVDAADAVEHARLAGAVRPDERQDLARLERERDVVNHLQAAESELEPAQLQLSHTSGGCGGIA